MADLKTTVSAIVRRSDKQQIIYGVVYSPGELDTWGEAMTAEDIELMAHRFMSLKLDETIDEMHDEKAKPDVYPIESFIARKGDPDYPEGSWVLGVKVENAEVWAKIESGEINGYSYQAYVTKIATIAEVEYQPEIIGITEPADDGHSHMFFVNMGEDGKVIKGMTTTENGHAHTISRGTATDEMDGHKHRYFQG